MSITNPNDALKLGEKTIKYGRVFLNYSREFFWPKNRNFEVLLDNLLSEIKKKEIPRQVAADRLSLILRDILGEYINTPHSNYYQMMTKVIDGVSNLSKNSRGSKASSPFYIPGNFEVHISCEPCLEGMLQPSVEDYSFFDLFENATSVTYYFSRNSNYSDLLKRIEQHPDASSLRNKFSQVEILKKTERPVFIITRKGTPFCGWSGNFHPPANLVNGKYMLTKALPGDWYFPINDDELVTTFNDLTK